MNIEECANYALHFLNNEIVYLSMQCQQGYFEDSYLCNCIVQIHVIISKPKFEIFLKQDFGNCHGNGTGDIDPY